MKTNIVLTVAALAAMAAVGTFPGCKPDESRGESDGRGQAGHKLARVEAAPRDPGGAPAQTPLSGARCSGHNAPKELCFICDASLREPGRLWCPEHKRYEDRCWECHPELQDKNRLWCQEHSLYEDECFLCRPELRGKGKTAAASGPALMCAEHGVLEAECGICRPQLAATLKPGESAKVRLPAQDSATIAGVQTTPPTLGAIAEAVECYAEMAFDQNKVTQITPLVSGVVKSVEASLGSRVSEGTVLARLDSVAISEAQSELRSALVDLRLREQTLERERALQARRISPEKDLQEAEAAWRHAEAAVQEARQHLVSLGFDREQAMALGTNDAVEAVLEIRAPFAGEIIERNVVRGGTVEAGKAIFTLADRSVMWAMLNLPEAALARVKLGQTVELRLESLPGQTFTGKLTWIAAEVDGKSRMARARAEVPNPEGLLKARMFAQARILTRQAEGALLVPASAIQRLEGQCFVFVQLADDLFDARSVRLGARSDGRVEIAEGLKPDEMVAVDRVFPLKSAFLISRLGAGCADD